jgi:hypothetical protein
MLKRPYPETQDKMFVVMETPEEVGILLCLTKERNTEYTKTHGYHNRGELLIL